MSGNEIIDGQHQELFHRSNLLIDSIVHDGTKDDVLAILSQLYDQTAHHFRSEEATLQKAEYDQFESHREEHQKLLKRLKSDIQRYKDIEIDEYEFVKFICHEIILKHLIEEDMKFFPLVKSL